MRKVLELLYLKGLFLFIFNRTEPIVPELGLELLGDEF